MTSSTSSSRFRVSSAVFNLLDPIPFGFFVATLIFDVIYASNANVMWAKSASWLVSMGLLFAIIPQLINLAWVWFSKRRVRTRGAAINFWLNVIGIVAALINAFVHSRDAYAVIPDAVWLSVVTVVAMGIGRIILAGEIVTFKESGHGKV
ncbi:putative membrane protein [Pseudoduganella lurida]|uniref:Putative membrane protein n=1 Tax=Pseudoduganella lurida TaxID=1036180 RepID=A0A562RLX0_9BURK|nr:DUF2231 domain-containing protein [Pseudoduganella lurida]TWI70031.1 putative membrane protein [Pseudoduganella lurida]